MTGRGPKIPLFLDQGGVRQCILGFFCGFLPKLHKLACPTTPIFCTSCDFWQILASCFFVIFPCVGGLFGTVWWLGPGGEGQGGIELTRPHKLPPNRSAGTRGPGHCFDRLGSTGDPCSFRAGPRDFSDMRVGAGGGRGSKKKKKTVGQINSKMHSSWQNNLCVKLD